MQSVLRQFPDIRIAFGESDEYSFVFHKDTRLYGASIVLRMDICAMEEFSAVISDVGRRASKLISLVTSAFSVEYVRAWKEYLGDVDLVQSPLFDGRAVLYPTEQCIRDYLSWRQADTHINCQYNTCYWTLIKEGKTREETQHMLKVRICNRCASLWGRHVGMSPCTGNKNSTGLDWNRVP